MRLTLTKDLSIRYSYPNRDSYTPTAFIADITYKNGRLHSYPKADSLITLLMEGVFDMDFAVTMAQHFRHIAPNDDDEVLPHVQTVIRTRLPIVPIAVTYGWDAFHADVFDIDGTRYGPKHMNYASINKLLTMLAKDKLNA